MDVGRGDEGGRPEYLLPFLDPRVVTENTGRQGFLPERLQQQPVNSEP